VLLAKKILKTKQRDKSTAIKLIHLSLYDSPIVEAFCKCFFEGLFSVIVWFHNL
jgi:hypothetical protein